MNPVDLALWAFAIFAAVVCGSISLVVVWALIDLAVDARKSRHATRDLFEGADNE